MPSAAIFARCAGLPPAGHAMTTCGRSATSRSMSIAATSPMRGTARAAGGSLEYCTVAMTCAPAPAANNISVAPGVRLTMRSGGCATWTTRPRSSGIWRSERRGSCSMAAPPAEASLKKESAKAEIIGSLNIDIVSAHRYARIIMNYLAERRQEEKERRRAEILDAAEAVVASVGWDALTMDQVARRARLSRALMYGICERGLATLRQRFAEAVARHRLGLDQIVGAGRAYIAFSQEFPVYFDILARCELREVNTVEATPNEAACQAAGAALQALMVAVLETGVRDGSIRADLGDPKVVANTLWGMTHGALQLAATKGKALAYHGVDGRAVIEQTMLMATRALAARP